MKLSALLPISSLSLLKLLGRGGLGEVGVERVGHGPGGSPCHLLVLRHAATRHAHRPHHLPATSPVNLLTYTLIKLFAYKRRIFQCSYTSQTSLARKSFAILLDPTFLILAGLRHRNR